VTLSFWRPATLREREGIGFRALNKTPGPDAGRRSSAKVPVRPRETGELGRGFCRASRAAELCYPTRPAEMALRTL
jgi:hypothetical protein